MGVTNIYIYVYIYVYIYMYIYMYIYNYIYNYIYIFWWFKSFDDQRCQDHDFSKWCLLGYAHVILLK
jgi:hypothetical protein